MCHWGLWYLCKDVWQPFALKASIYIFLWFHFNTGRSKGVRRAGANSWARRASLSQLICLASSYAHPTRRTFVRVKPAEEVVRSWRETWIHSRHCVFVAPVPKTLVPPPFCWSVICNFCELTYFILFHHFIKVIYPPLSQADRMIPFCWLLPFFNRRSWGEMWIKPPVCSPRFNAFQLQKV